MTFLDAFTSVTGTEFRDGEVRLIDAGGGRPSAPPRFVNSGVGLSKRLDPNALDFDVVGDGFEEFFAQGPRIKPTLLAMPAGCLDQGPHGHPGGEFSYVIEGEYFDGDMEGSVIRSYPAGSVVFYAKGSTHRPLSHKGAKILYVPFDGIVFGKDASDLARKMVKVGTPAEALEYALLWMEPDPARRRELEDALLTA